MKAVSNVCCIEFPEKAGEKKKRVLDQEAESTRVSHEPSGLCEKNIVEEKWLTHLWGEDFTTSIHISLLKLSSYIMF